MNSTEETSQQRLNPYEAPKSDLETFQTDGSTLASRWSRFFARLIDEIILLVINWLLVSWLVGQLIGTDNANVVYELFLIPYSDIDLLDLFLTFLAYVLLNVYLLAKRGQTIGKLLLSIRIVDYYSDEITPLRFSLVLREGILSVFNLVGVLGWFLILIDAVFIFSRNRRCLHDYWAFTKVVKVSGIQHTTYA